MRPLHAIHGQEQAVRDLSHDVREGCRFPVSKARCAFVGESPATTRRPSFSRAWNAGPLKEYLVVVEHIGRNGEVLEEVVPLQELKVRPEVAGRGISSNMMNPTLGSTPCFLSILKARSSGQRWSSYSCAAAIRPPAFQADKYVAQARVDERADRLVMDVVDPSFEADSHVSLPDEGGYAPCPLLPLWARAEEIRIGGIEISGSGAGDDVVRLLDDVLGAALPPATRGPVRRSAAEEGVDVAECASSVAAAASEDVTSERRKDA